jgi:hypothetical protein
MRDAASPLPWTERAWPSRIAAALVLAAALGAGVGCGASNARLAARILEDHRSATHTHPLPGSRLIRLALSAGGSTGTGVEEIEWGNRNYRESVSSAGFRTVRGIQGDKAYFTDEDGVTRVLSEPQLAELVTHSYFWRRAWLFDDAERARLALGPADPGQVSVQITPHGGNALLLIFARQGLRLVAVRTPGLDLDVSSPTRWTDRSRPRSPVEVDQRYSGLPTGSLEDAAIGGWSGVWPSPVADAPFIPAAEGTAVVTGSVAGRDLRIAIDGESDGPLRVRPAPAAALPLTWKVDVFGRRLARGARLAVGTFTEPSIAVEATDAIPEGADASVGAALFREAIVEYDRDGGRLRLHDPERWVRPEGYYRCVLDDDGDRPVAVLHRAKETLRLVAGASGLPALRVAPEAAVRAGLPESGPADDLRWGPAPLPPLDVLRVALRFEPARGDDGRLSTSVLLRFRAVMDLVHRWAYLRPEGAAVKGDPGEKNRS